MAVKSPGSRGVATDQNGQPFSWFDRDGMFPRKVCARTVFEIHPHPVQMERMLHHRVVDEREPKALAIAHANGFLCIRILLAIEGPHVTLHMAGKMDLDLSLRLSLVLIGNDAFQVGVEQYAPDALFEPAAWFVHPIAGILCDRLVAGAMMVKTVPY